MTADAIADGPEREQTQARDLSRLGEYRLVQRLGEGGMGVVHLGLDGHGRAVAVKVLRQHIAHDPDARARLHREVETLGRIRSPRVAPIVDADVDGDTPYIVTRYVPGPSLDERVAERGPLPPDDLHRVASGLAEALDVIHSAGVVHRDVKPANILVREDGLVKLTDFGIAHIVDDIRLTLTGLVMGTPGYLAPEVVGGDDVTPATDWWGWAATTAYAASGTPPFGKGAMSAVLARVAQGEPDLLAVDPRIEPLLYAALSPDPRDRPHHHEVMAALERYAVGAPVTEAFEIRRVRPSTQVLTTPPTAALPLPPAAARPSGTGAGAPVAASAPAGSAPRTEEAGAGAGAPGVPPPSAGGARAGTGYAVPPAGTGYAVPPAPTPNGRPAGTPGWEHARPVDRPPAEGRPLPPTPPASRPEVPSTESDWDAARLGHGPYGDPRIGRPSRSGTLLALLALLAALTARAPYLGALVLLGWMALARTADRSVTSLVMRRHQRGARGSDVAVAVATGPWHLVVGLVGAAVTVVLPLVVGVCAMFASALVLAAFAGADLRSDGIVPLAVGGAFAALTAWWGPGGASLRRGSRSLVRGLAPTPVATRVAVVVLLLAAAALVASAATTVSGPTWWPSDGAPGWVDQTIPLP